MEKRFTLTNGFTRLRWLFLVVGIFTVQVLFIPEVNIIVPIAILMSCGLFFFLFWGARKIKFDSKHLYIIKGKREKVVPLRNVLSIKASGSKVNSRRVWVLVYEDEGVQERKCRYIPALFSDYNKEFKAAVKAANPDVVIWDHPYFHD